MADDLDSLWNNGAQPVQQSAPAQPSLDDLWNVDNKTNSGSKSASSLPTAKAAVVAPVSPWVDVGKSLAVGARENIEGILGLPGDLHAGASWLIDKALQKIAPTRTPTSDPASAGIMTSSDFHNLTKSAGVPDYTPQTPQGDWAKTLGSFVPGALLMPETSLGGIAANLAKYAVAPAVTSEAAGQAVKGTKAEPYVRAAAGLAGGLGAEGVEQLGRAGLGAYKQFVEPMSEAGRQNWGARTLQGMASNPNDVRDALNTAKNVHGPGQALGEKISGSAPTLGQLSGDKGILAAERQMATLDSASFKSNDFGTGSEQQNAARSQALQDVQPTGSPEAVSQTVRDRLAQIETQHDATVASAHQTAQTAASAIGGGATPEAIGANLRDALQGGRDVAKVNETKLWNATDPDGTLAMPAATISEPAAQTIKTMSPAAKPMDGEEAAIFNTAANFPAVAPFRDVTELRSRISTAMRVELRGAGRTPSYARLAGLRGSVEDAIFGAVENQAFLDKQGISVGRLNPANSIGARLEGAAHGFDGDYESTAGSGGGHGESGVNTSGVEASGVRGVDEAAGPADVGPRNVAGSASVQGGSAAGPPTVAKSNWSEPTVGAAPPKPQSLLSHLINAGGVKNESGELTNFVRRYPGLVNNKRGLSLDATRESAAQAGYLGSDIDATMANTTPSHFLDALQNAHEVYSSRNTAETLARQEHAQSKSWVPRVKSASAEADQYSRENGLGSLDPEHAWTAGELMAEHGMGADQALEQSAKMLYERDAEIARKQNGEGVHVVGNANNDARLSRKTSAREFPGRESPVEGPSSSFRDGRENAGSQQGNFNPVDKEDVQKLNAASAATKNRVQTYDKGPVGAILKTKEHAGDYRLADAEVPAKVFSPGPSGAQTVAAYRKAAGPNAETFLQDAAAQSLSRNAMTDGVIDPGKYATWTKNHQDAIRALPNALKAKFDSAASASEAYAQAVNIRKNALDLYQNSAIKPFLNISNAQDVTRTVGGMFEASNGVRRMSQLADTIKGNPDAQQGLRKAVADYIISKSTGTTEAGTSGIENLNASRFQTLIRNNEQTLKAAGFSDENVSLMKQIGEDMQRSQRTLSATRLPGQSNTAQDIIHNINAASQPRTTLLNKIMAMGVSGYLYSPHAAMVGAGSAIFQHIIFSLRNAGISTAAGLVRDAINNPEFAHALMEMTPKQVGPGAYTNIKKALAKMATFTTETVDQNQKHRAFGGAVKRKSHEELVSRLMGASEKAKASTKRDTKDILNVPDNTVAKALAIAQKAI